jgi:hypothetical protein
MSSTYLEIIVCLSIFGLSRFRARDKARSGSLDVTMIPYTNRTASVDAKVSA